MLQLRDYQERSLETLTEYLRQVCEEGADVPFYRLTKRAYKPAPRLTGLPYICLRVPTGGGKTLMACHALDITAKEYLQVDRTVCLWLAPSNAIVNQTLGALKNRHHPYREVIDVAFAGNVQVMDLSEALYVTKGDFDGATCVVVTTLQALRIEDTEGRKVYESAGALQPHFGGLFPNVQAELEFENQNHPIYSLANVLKMRRPVIIMDEAHNARTPLSFDTLARFNPSCIIEFTATPETNHVPDRGFFASNVLHHVSALELKEAEMVKLPIKLRMRAEWKEIVAEAIEMQRVLETLAIEEQRETGEYIRPIVLLQAQSVNRDDINVDRLKQALTEDFKIPEEQIAIATGATRQIDNINLFDTACPIRFIITVRALAEGWDCSFAYVLCSVSEISTHRSVEQVLGRILRLPNAKKKLRPALNVAYTFAASQNFIRTAKSLRDALVEGAGFQRLEASDLVIPEDPQRPLWDTDPLFLSASEPVTYEPNLIQLPSELRERVTYNESESKLVVKGVLSEQDKKEIQSCFTNEKDKQAVERIFHRTHGRYVGPESPEKKDFISIPLLAIRVGEQLELFEESHFLDIPWNLAECDSSLSESEFPSEFKAGSAVEIDVNDTGRIEMANFVHDLHENLRLFSSEPGWTLAELSSWLDHQIPHPDIPLAHSSLFIHNVLTSLIESRGLQIDHLARNKFRLSKAIMEIIEKHRSDQRKKSYQTLLFGSEPASIEVGTDVQLTFEKDRYAPNWFYEPGYKFQKHLFPLIGELKSDGEEFECAVFLDTMSEVKKWVRNLERRPETSFWLQTSTDRFYPDFIALLNDDRILVVEYKGEDRWSNDDSKEKRAVGNLWEARSGGKCLFVMPKGKDWNEIKGKIS